METKFTQFLRSGGSGGYVLSRGTQGVIARPLSRKAEIPGLAALQQQFATNLDFADQINGDLLLRFTRDGFQVPLSAADLADVSGDKAAAIQAWSARLETIWAEHGERPSRFKSVRRAMEENLITSFSGLINERRQRALGIDQYIWRSRDDDKVRHVHAEHDDKVFDWDNPPETGHPGQAYNCRCFAEPYLLNEPKCEPDFAAAQVAHGRGVDAGVWEAIKDTLTDIWQTLSEIPENLAWVTRLGVLSARERFGTLSDEEQAELDGMRQAVEDRVEEIKAFWRDFPETAKAFAEYAYAVETRPGMVMDEYARCRATLAQVEEAARERAYLNTLIALNVAPAGLAAKLLRRRGRSGDTSDPDRLRDELLDEAENARRLPSDPDWDIIDNPGIQWGGPIKEQGGPWEDHLELPGDLGDRTPDNFKTFDFFNRDTGIATSAKTLDTRAQGYLDRPSRIYGALKRYIDQIDRFDGDVVEEFPINPGEIDLKRLELAIPNDTTPEQFTQIQRAIDYAESLGIDVEVSRIR
ncbi:minor capsid protein [Epibacterium sp. MM17-32]|uniref:endonuclease toxin domain-containing protein n=1 Tax=Epibacterium sp. MM17-32 TaxID=2917734 RepID=UPI001EF48BF9|nr:phage minor head protein [Epibacterium sp. MM17-32]MCG7630080.1 minor capsid protein [Epibacterium sp. MM17-32]